MISPVDLDTFNYRKRPSVSQKCDTDRQGIFSNGKKCTTHEENREIQASLCARSDQEKAGSNGDTDSLLNNSGDGRSSEFLDRNFNRSCYSTSKLQQLCEMFPDEAESRLHKVLDSTKSLEEAVQRILAVEECVEGDNGPTSSSGKKRQACDMDDSELDTQRKKLKLLCPNRRTSCSHKSTNKISQSEQDKQDLEQMKEVFPHLRKRDLKEVLASSESVDEAIYTLSSYAAENSASNGVSEVIEISDDDCLDGDQVLVANESGANHTNDDSDDEDFTAEQKATILSFFDECSVQELSAVPGCSVKKARKILSLRIFYSWDDLVSKLNVAKGISTMVLSDCLTLLEERERVDKLMNRCEAMSSNIRQMLTCRGKVSKTNVAEDTTEDAEVDDDVVVLDDSPKRTTITSQPKLLTSSRQLKAYQMEGLNWLVLMHDQGVNGILADEMGLGKTVQTIAFLVHLIESNEKCPHLIVVPSSTLSNWVREFEVWCPSVDVLRYHGSKDDRMNLKMDVQEGILSFKVMVTTYAVAKEDRSFLRKLKFHYVVFDEAHMLKNMQCQRYQQLMKIRASRRLLLTGTPFQNNLLELMSLLSFVMPEMFGASAQGIKFMFSNTNVQSEPDSGYERERVEQARRIMQPFVLRRVKADVLLQLPQKHAHVVTCSMTDRQRQLYDDVFLTCSSEYKSDTASTRNYQSILMRMRKAANHPLLLRKLYQENQLLEMARKYCKDPEHHDSNPDIVFEDMTVMSDFELHRLCNQEKSLTSHALDRELLLDSGKFSWLDSHLPQMKDEGSRVLLFSQFVIALDVIEAYLQDRGHHYVRLDGSTKLEERQVLIDKFNSDSSVFVFLLSTKAGGLGINLASANIVILHDIDFNPHNDKQAEDRSHRVGQTRDVHVYKLISENTIEEAMLRCADRKLKLEQDMATKSRDDTPDIDTEKFLLEVFS